MCICVYACAYVCVRMLTRSATDVEDDKQQQRVLESLAVPCEGGHADRFDSCTRCLRTRARSTVRHMLVGTCQFVGK
jgi:hypothetical protein